MTYDYKRDFPIFQHTDVAYIDNAATAQRPQCVLDAVADFYRCHNANPLRGLYPLSVEATDIYEQARETVRDFIGARSAREIVFTRNTTESLNLVAYSYGLTHVKAGDEVLVSIMEHHSDLLPWQMVCRQTGAELKFIECAPDGSVDLQQIESLITERTKIVAMTQVSNVLGRKYPLKEVAAMAHKKGAVMVVDGAQSTPHMPVNVQELGADFFAFSGHKVFGPMGVGGLYGREDLLEEMPPFLSGGEMIESVTRTGAVYAELPHKFEAGTVNAAGAAGLAAAIQYVQSVGFDTIQQREHDLTANALARVLAVPHVHVLGTDRPEDHNGIITFTVDGVHPHDISEIMASDGVGAFVSEFVALVVSFADNTGETIVKAEIHELAFCLGAYLIYMLYKPKKKLWFWVLFGLTCFCFLAAFKRIAMVAIAVVALIRVILFLFAKISQKAVLRATNAVMLISVVLLIGYIWIIKSDFFTYIEKIGLDTSGRAFIYSHVNNYYSFSPSFVGRGIGFLTYQLNESVSLGVSAVHNDFLQFYIDLGFFGYILWLLSMTVLRTKYFGKNDPDSAVITALLTVYLIVVSSTDNTMNYPLLTTVMGVIIIGNSYANKVRRQTEYFDTHPLSL